MFKQALPLTVGDTTTNYQTYRKYRVKPLMLLQYWPMR